VIHDRQVKVCRMCIQPGHILRECPDFKCRKCGTQGHYARECERQEQREEERGGGEGPHGDEASAAAEVARATEAGGASESDAEGGSGDSGEQQMEEDGEKDREENEMQFGEEKEDALQNGEAEVDTEAEATPREATPREAGGESVGTQSSLDCAQREMTTEAKKWSGATGKERDGGKRQGKTEPTLGGLQEGREGTGKTVEVGQGGEGMDLSDITDSGEDHCDAVAAARKRPLGRKIPKRHKQ